jgi:pimeloyl-ACP methyl ester carboxylesterase
VQCPVLGIWSDGDHYLTEEPMKTSGQRIKGPYDYVRITGASHWMMVEKPAEINARLLAFLQK